MAEIPLYLKLKGEDVEPRSQQKSKIQKVSDRSIKFEGKKYDFVKVFLENESVEELLDGDNGNGTGLSACWIFIGPTGAGKTTTLRRVLSEKRKRAQVENEVEVTAFEVVENKHVVDLLEPRLSSKRKDGSSTLSIESVLCKRHLNEKVLSEIFSRRHTRRTNFNYESSRSCLVITLYDNGRRVTYIDLMGNERFDKTAPSSNVFANMNVSSITQLLTNKVISGRSSNLITNLIFRKDSEENRKISVVLHLDTEGDGALVKSALNNIATLVKKFKVNYKGSPSRTIQKNSESVPHYARPTLSSLSPQKITPSVMGKFRSRIGKNQFNKLSLSAPKLYPAKRRLDDSSSPTPSKRRSPLNPVSLTNIPQSSPTKSPDGDLIKQYNDLRVVSLGKRIEDLEYENCQLKREHDEILRQVKSGSDDIAADFSMVRTDSEINNMGLKAELESLQRINEENERKLSQRTALSNEFSDFKQEFQLFKEKHGSFEQTALQLKESIMNLQKKNDLLEADKIEDADSIDSLQKSLNEMQTQKSELASRLEVEQKERIKISETIVSLTETRDDLSHRLNDAEQMLSITSSEKDVLIKDYENSIESKDSEISDLIAEKTTLESTMNEQIADIDSLNDRISEKNKQVENLQLALSERDAEIESLQSNLIDTKSKLSEAESFKSNDEELSRLKNDYEDLKSSFSEVDKKYKELMSSNDEAAKKYEDEINCLRETLESTEKDLRSYRNNERITVDDLNESKAKLGRINDEKVDLSKSLDKVSSELSNLKKSEKEKSMQIEELRIRNENLLRELEESRKSATNSSQIESESESADGSTVPAKAFSISDQGQITKSSFNPSDIFSDNGERKSSSPENRGGENRPQVKKNKKVLGNSNKHENYKSLVNSIAKEKKLKKKSSHKKNKSAKINGV